VAAAPIRSPLVVCGTAFTVAVTPADLPHNGPSLDAGSPAGPQISCVLQPGGAAPHVPRHTPPGDRGPDAGAGTSIDRRGPEKERDPHPVSIASIAPCTGASRRQVL